LIIRINRKAVSIVNVRAIYFSYRRNVLKNMIDLCITRSFLSNSDIIVTAGERLKEIIIRNWKVRRKQIKVIPSAVREEFRNNTCKAGLPKEENWNLIYVGRMHPIKGLEYLLDALRILIDYPITLHIVAALDGTRYCKKILRKIEDDRLISRIKLHGRVCDINRLIRLYLSSHISVLSSLWDTYPTALVESMCVGLPVVATTVGDIPYIVENGRTGILVSPKDHIRMAHAIRYLVEHRDVWVSMSERSFERSKIFRQRGWEDVADEFNQAIFRKDSVN
jgi:glycosyltransferase involved in cell wall biosynthesis